MSEAEKRRRFYYKQTRNKWISIGAMILAGALLVTIIFAAIFFSLNKSTFISYAEKGDITYKVYLQPNSVFTSTYLEQDQIYVATLIDDVVMNFDYRIQMAQEAQYSYTYSADAKIVIKDKASGKLFYEGKLSPNASMLLPEQTRELEQPKETLTVTQDLTINYQDYDKRAREILELLSLKTAVCTLEVEMKIHVNGSSDELAEDKNDAYTFALSMPLNSDAVAFERTSSVPQGTNKLLTVNKGSARIVMLVFAIIFAVLTTLFAIAYVAFIILTRNTDINYNRRVKKIVSNYKSFIQKITSPFDREGYQLLMMDSFMDLLEIRDTIQSPILMSENEDQTCTTFMIPTNTKLLYIFEIKVEDYDELYGYTKTIEANTILDLGDEEELTILEDVDADELVEALKQPDVPLSELEYDEDEAVETEDEEGVDVVGVAYPMRRKVYHYDPNGGLMDTGDIILVPDKDEESDKEVIRKATVSHPNRKVEPESVESPLRKVIGIFKRKAEEALMPKEEYVEIEETEEIDDIVEADEILETDEIVEAKEAMEAEGTVETEETVEAEENSES